MILKSLSRKDAGCFRQLMQYVTRDALKADLFTFNLLHSSQTEIVTELENNAQFLKRRKNGVRAYHEIIALPASSMTPVQVTDCLQTLAQKYLELRAPDHLAFGQVHLTRHPHIHLVISSNPIRSPKTRRLSQAKFGSIRRQLEAFKCQRFPNLPQKLYETAHQVRQVLKSLKPQREVQQNLMMEKSRQRSRHFSH